MSKENSSSTEPAPEVPTAPSDSAEAESTNTIPSKEPEVPANSEVDDEEEWGVSTRLFALGLFTIGLIAATVLFLHFDRTQPVAIKQFTNVYSFVEEKVSKSASIKINVPAGVTEELAKQSITFSPEVPGTWQEEDVEGVVVYQPAEPLTTGVYYAVNMDAGDLQMSGDFLVDEDPEIIAVFPAAGSETHEDTEISIIFNRPMVPVTTLTESEALLPPVTITPETPGRFKWISTRNLQFIPETTLVPSSVYNVEIAEGFYSADGLPVDAFTHQFVTRPLRYESLTSGTVSYSRPVYIRFNQPVDLDKTRDMVTVTSDNTEVPIIVEYGERTYYENGKRLTEEDLSTLVVYQVKDQYGRKRLWDFETSYRINLKGAVPLVGNKELKQTKSANFNVPTIISGVDAKSERSSYVKSSLFDPQGTLEVSFYEAVDLNRSRFEVKGLKDVVYAEKCKEDENGRAIYYGSNCEKEDDLEKLIFSFHENSFGRGEDFMLTFEKIYTPDGLLMNHDPLEVALKTYPEIEVYSMTPGAGDQAAELDGVTLCTNVPLRTGDADYLMEAVKTENYIIYGDAYHSRYRSDDRKGYKCSAGQFETKWQYGILPDRDYTMRYVIEDEFAQQTEQTVVLHTRTNDFKSTRFQNMQQQYNVTTPDKTKLAYVTENLESVQMQICKLSPERFLELMDDRPKYSGQMSTANCQNIVQEIVTLPPRFWVNNYFQVDLAQYFADTRGHYVVSFTYQSQNYKQEITTRYDHTYVSVTNLAVGKKEVINAGCESDRIKQTSCQSDSYNDALSSNSNLYWVTNANTLEPLYGATVQQFAKGSAVTGPVITNGEGLASVPIAKQVYGAVIKHGLDSAVVSDWADALSSSYYARAMDEVSKTYIYTDRPIYRPGDTVHIKGIDRFGFDGEYEFAEGMGLTLSVNAPGSRGSDEIFSTPLSVSAYGTFDTEFTIPEDAPLGSYWISAFGQRAYFSVEEYVPAAFKLDLETNKEEYTNGDEFELSVQADYYFGVPLSEGTVGYRVVAQNYHFDRYEDEYFNFGGGWYYCYWCGYGDDYLFDGATEIDEHGRAKINRRIDINKLFEDEDEQRSKIITVYVTAKDINGRSVSGQKSFIVHQGDFYIGGKTSKYYTSVNDPVQFRVKTVDQQGGEKSIRNLTMTVNKVTWETYKRQEVDGGYYYRSEKKLEPVDTKTFKTDSNGNWSYDLSLAETGSYQIEVRGTDDAGNVIKSVSSLYIYGNSSVYIPPKNNYELDIEVDKTDVNVGETASIMIKSPYERAKALITVERGVIYDQWVVNVDNGLYLHEFPVKFEYAPNFYVSALLMAEGPEVSYGSVEFRVGHEEQTLDITAKTNKDYYLPGEEVTMTIQAKDHTGAPVSAEVSVAVADLSVLALKGNPKKDPASFFYDGFPLSVTTASNIKNILHEVEIPLGTKGGGGGTPDDLAAKKRGEFRDTAYWSANVLTDINGQATITFTLPDNLTTWQVESLGVTKDTKLGVDYQEFTTKKQLMATPLKPRFVVPGDVFSLGAKIFNQSEEGRKLSVKIESETLEFDGDAAGEIFVNSGTDDTVYFKVVAPRDIKEGVHRFTFTVNDGELIDSVEQTITITPNTTYETVATAGYTDQDVVTEYVYVPDLVEENMGGLTINANATMAVFLKDARDYMARYPYGCSEQLSSSLSTIATLTRALEIPNVEGEMHTFIKNGIKYTPEEVVAEGLQKIYNAQKPSGGFAYYPESDKEYFNLTIHVLDAMHQLRQAGYEVDTKVMDKALLYVENNALVDGVEWRGVDREDVIMAEYVAKSIRGYDSPRMQPQIESMIADDKFLNESISSVSLAYLSIITVDGYSTRIKNKVYNTLLNRIEIDGRGAYLKDAGYSNRSFWSGSVKNTALLLRAFTAHEDKNPMLRNVQDWLLRSRDRHGAWGGTHKTYQVVAAFVDYLEWQKETEAAFSLRGLLDGTERFSYDFTPQNVFTQFSHVVPMSELKTESLQTLRLEKEDNNGRENNLYYDMSLRYYLPASELPPRDEGITITREIVDLENEEETNTAEVGEVLKGRLTITISTAMQHIIVEDMIPAGFEVVNFSLSTESEEMLENRVAAPAAKLAEEGSWWDRVLGRQSAQTYGYRTTGGSYNNLRHRSLRPSHTEMHDDRVFLYSETFYPGVYEYEYYIRALVPGEFQHLPARAEDMFYPEIFGRTSGGTFTVTLK